MTANGTFSACVNESLRNSERKVQKQEKFKSSISSKVREKFTQVLILDPKMTHSPNFGHNQTF